MAVKIRLARGGAKKKPCYRIVVADARAPRDGSFIEKVGFYDAMVDGSNPNRVKLDVDRINYWLSIGAIPTLPVAKFLEQEKSIKLPKAIAQKLDILKAQYPQRVERHKLEKQKASEAASA